MRFGEESGFRFLQSEKRAQHLNPWPQGRRIVAIPTPAPGRNHAEFLGCHRNLVQDTSFPNSRLAADEIELAVAVAGTAQPRRQHGDLAVAPDQRPSAISMLVGAHASRWSATVAERPRLIQEQPSLLSPGTAMTLALFAKSSPMYAAAGISRIASL